MDLNHPYFLNDINMNNDYFDLSRPTKMATGPSGSGTTPTSSPKTKKHRSDIRQCFDVLQMTMLNGTVKDITKCKLS